MRTCWQVIRKSLYHSKIHIGTHADMDVPGGILVGSSCCTERPICTLVETGVPVGMLVGKSHSPGRSIGTQAGMEGPVDTLV